MVKLKPCPDPWCHSHTCTMDPCSSLDLPRVKVRHRNVFWVGCGASNCMVNGPHYKTKEAAIEAWNTRHVPEEKDNG